MEEKTEQNFTLPCTLTEYPTFKSFLDDQEKVEIKEDDLIGKLFGLNLENSNINLSMFIMPQEVQVQRYVNYQVPQTWENIFNSEIGSYEINRAFKKLQSIAAKGYNIFPLEEDIFRAFHLCKQDNLKVVILGQDPYHDFDQALSLPTACGLSFSGRRDGKKPGSLNNIFKEIDNTFPGIPLQHSDLSSWAEQGVLLLNTCLTVNQSSPESHIKEKVWNFFTEYVIKTISDEIPGVIFCLWGAKAKAYGIGSKAIIGRKSVILESGHPSNLNSSVHKFVGNNHFAYIYYEIERQNTEIYEKNIILQQQQKPLLKFKEQINWSLIK